MSTNERKTYIRYPSIIEQIKDIEKCFGEQMAYKFSTAVDNYGAYGVLPDDDTMYALGFQTIIELLDKCNDRYEKAKTNGAKGGAPRKNIDMNIVHEMLNAGTPKTQIAKYFNCDVTTINNRLKEEANTQKNTEKNTEKMKNLYLYDNQNNNDNVKENIKEKEMITEERKKELKEIIGSDGSYKDEFIDCDRFDFYDLTQDQQIDIIVQNFTEFTRAEAKYIITDILS